MTTAAPRPHAPASPEELDERTQLAWNAYRESLRDLNGREYDDAEHRSWERLQRELRAIERLR